MTTNTTKTAAVAAGTMLFDNWLCRRSVATIAPPRTSHPLWTYFEVAEAHQWLRLGRVDRVWSTLDWLWSLQTTPGLYTLWEGDGEENSFEVWKQNRGWVRPPNVTPHYWSAAEMLLLQLAMLAETQAGSNGEELVIGSGVPAK